MAVDHYENFPVASVLVPGRLRQAVVNIYRFARSADDIADEGNDPAPLRQARLQEYKSALDQIACQGSVRVAPHLEGVFKPLADSIRQHHLPLPPFYDLLSAFAQDTETARYESDQDLFDYCRRSANPVGHLMLHLYEAATAPNLADADSICTGLQLTNFWQDVAVDWTKNRVYVPRQRLAEFGVTEAHIANATLDNAWRALMQHQVAQARSLLLKGYGLPSRLPLRLALELRMVIQGALRILERLDDLNYDIFNHRPTLKARDWVAVATRAIMQRSAPIYPGQA